MNSSSGLYLREDVYFEPLINQWYAWPYLIPPVTAARHMVNTHKRIMSSFVKNYQLHIMAAKDPNMAGGEFLSCTEEQVSDVKDLIEKIDNSCKDLIELSSAVKELDDLLRKHKSGETIEGLYANIPEPLKGYVELFFDINHNTSYRLIEPLLYNSHYYKPNLQSVSFGLLNRIGERPFVFSTPRFADQNHLQIDMEFNNIFLDKIFMSRENPISPDEFDELSRMNKFTGGLSFRDLFTESAPQAINNAVQNGLRLQYTGHAGFLIESPDLSILIDPVIASRGDDNADGVISFSELPANIDYICLTHNHQDHVNLETLLQLRYKTDKVLVPKNNGGSLADPSIRLLLKKLGFTAIEVDDMDEIPIPGGRITSIPFLGEHGDLNIRSKTAWHFDILGKKMLFGADSTNLDRMMYEHIHSIVGNVDILAIGMECVGAPYTWLYGALNTQKISKNIKHSRRLNGSDFEQAFNMVEIFKPEKVYIYALGMEPWYKYFMGLEYGDESKQIIESNKMIEACKETGVNAEAMYGKNILEIA